MTVEKPKPKQLLPPITTGADSAMNQSQVLAITCKSLKGREKSREQGAIAFGFASHWLKNWRESFKPITKRSNGNHVITLSLLSHLKTALTYEERKDRSRHLRCFAFDHHFTCSTNSPLSNCVRTTESRMRGRVCTFLCTNKEKSNFVP